MRISLAWWSMPGFMHRLLWWLTGWVLVAQCDPGPPMRIKQLYWTPRGRKITEGD